MCAKQLCDMKTINIKFSVYGLHAHFENPFGFRGYFIVGLFHENRRMIQDI